MLLQIIIQQYSAHNLPTQLGYWVSVILCGNWREVCMNGIMKWGTQSAHWTTRREEAHHQATPRSNIHVHLRSSEKFFPWRSHSQNTSEITMHELQTLVKIPFLPKHLWAYSKNVVHPTENELSFREWSLTMMKKIYFTQVQIHIVS